MAEEIESRYLVPDRIIFDRLRLAQQVGGLAVSPSRTVHARDTYLDTHGRALQRQGWVCRIRKTGDSVTVTLKGPQQTQGAIVERAEWELALDRHTERVARWPESELRTRVQELTGGSALIEVVRFRQTRHVADLVDGERLVGELSLDAVKVTNDGVEQVSLMLEAEIASTGTRADLERLDAVLVAEYGLLPEPRSKVQRALAMAESTEPLDADIWQRVRPATPEVIGRRYGADVRQAARVAELAERLCDVLGSDCGLSEHGRMLLHAAAWMHDVGRIVSVKDRQTSGRDIVLRHPLAGASAADRQAIAAAVYLQRGQVTPESISQAVPGSLPEDQRQETLHVAALLRMAVALAQRLPETGTIRETRPASGGLRLVLHAEGSGARAARRAATRAARRSDLWGMISEVRLEWAAATLSEDGTVLTPAHPANVLGLNPWDAMPAAAHKILAFYTQQMLDHEAGTRLGEDPEELHAMRVATRRLRSALRLLGPYLGTPLAEPVNEGLRRLGRALGAVRDMDVAIIKMEAYRQRLPAEQAPGLESLMAAWRHSRGLAHSRLTRYLDGRNYAHLHDRIATLLQALQGGERQVPVDQQVGQIAPRMVYLYWKATRAYTAILPHATAELMHLLRIECKRLRFALEFFGDVLPPPIACLANEVVGLQDHLGTLRDEIVAIEMLDRFLARPHTRPRREAVMGYREACVASRQSLAESFPGVWASLDRKSVSRDVERMVKERRG
jgi:CHAD domain-containing protein